MDQIKQIHSLAIRKGLAMDANVYSKIIALCCTRYPGGVKYARDLFDTILEPHVFIWNTMIKSYSQINCPLDAVALYVKMLRNNVRPDNYTFPFLLKGFKHDIGCGKAVHTHICKFGFDLDAFVQSSLVHMYCLHGQMDMARGVFDRSETSDVVTWNAMISGYNRREQFEEPRKLFKMMEERQIMPTSVTLVSVLLASSELKDLDTGKQVHQYVKGGMVESNLRLNNALINMYALCREMEVALCIFSNMEERDVISWTSIIKGFVNSGQVDEARKYFYQMPQRDSVSWTAIIDGYLKMNKFNDVLLLFREMQEVNVKPDEFTLVSVLTACAHLGALELGEWVRAYIDKYNIKGDIYVSNALIDMYFKCGDITKAMEMFNKMPRRDKFTWTAMVVGLATNGHGREALNMFSEMLNASETPDEITYIGVLSACTHCGMVNEGRCFFASMVTHHGIQPNVVHYGCIVDLLGRAGLLRNAYEVIKSMPMKPNAIVWGALLGACRVHKDVEMAEMAADKLFQLEPENGAVYILLCNIYADCKKWHRLQGLRKTILDRGIKVSPGCSLIEVNGIVHEFQARDLSHPLSKEIYLKLKGMTEDMKSVGFLPDTSELFLDIAEEEGKTAQPIGFSIQANQLRSENLVLKSEL